MNLDSAKATPQEPVLVFGGSFDPLHNGHVSLVRRVMQAGGYSSVVWVPSFQNPLKKHSPQANNQARLEMLRSVCADNSQYYVSDIEIRRGGSSYMLQTIQQMQTEFGWQKRPGLLIGDDNLSSFHQWYGWQELLAQCRLEVVSRVVEKAGKIYGTVNRLVRRVPDAEICLHTIPPIPISATAIRQAIARGENDDWQALVPSEVTEIIREYSLYQKTHYQIDGRAYRKVQRFARQTLSRKRFLHSIRVKKESQRLARRFGLDPHEAALAAISHDLAREWSDRRLLECAEKSTIGISSFQRQNPMLLHGLCAAEILKNTFGIQNQAVLEAVTHHTLGAAGMGPLAMLIFIADYTEAKRPYAHELRRALQNCNLQESCRIVLEHQRRQYGALSGPTMALYTQLEK